MADTSAAVEQLFLTFLSRRPTNAEQDRATAHLSAARTPRERELAIEDLAWVCVNKIDFLFSY